MYTICGNLFWLNDSASNRKERKSEKKTYLSFILRHIGALVESRLSCSKSEYLESASVCGYRKKRLCVSKEVFKRLLKEEGRE